MGRRTEIARAPLREAPEGPPALEATQDGSHTLYHEGLHEWYHSRHGAITESMHVFIEEGLRAWRSVHPQASRAVVFEMGLGSGLNALLAWREAHRLPLPLLYRAVERYPVGPEVWERLNYGDRLAEGRPEAAQALRRLHTAPWEEAVSLDEGFTLVKHRGGLADYAFEAASLDVVFFDAFAPDKQPDLWSSVVFRRLGAALRPGGVLTTYSAKGVVRRRLEAAGLRVEKRVGPPGKREMLRAWRPGAD